LVPDTLLLNRYRLINSVDILLKDSELNVQSEDGLESLIHVESSDELKIEYFNINAADTSLQASGRYNDGAFKGALKADSVNINHVIGLMNSELDLKGMADLDVEINFANERISAEGRINMDEFVLGDMPINNFNSYFSYSQDELFLEDTYVRDPQYMDIEAEGRISENSDLQLHINRLSMSVLSSLTPEISSAGGFFKGDFFVEGSRANPVIKGHAELIGGNLKGRRYFEEINDINSRIEAEGSKILLESFSASWNPGELTGAGYIDFSKSPPEQNFRIETVGDKGIFVKVPYLDVPQSTIFGSYLNLPAQGEPRGSLVFHTEEGEKFITADIVLANAHFTYPPSEVIDTPEAPQSSFLEEVNLNIYMEAGSAVWYENNYARARVNGSLTFNKEPGGSLLVNGELFSDQGSVTYFNRNFTLKEVRVTFEDGREYVQGSAFTEVSRSIDDDLMEEDEIEMQISRSRIADMEPRFSSSRFANTTTSGEAAELALAGVKFDDLSVEERNMIMRRELLRAIDANLTSPLVQNILRQADLVDVARVDVKFEEDIHNEALYLRGAGLKLGRQLTDRFYMGYYIEYGAAIDNPLRLSHELDMSYRMRESQFLRGRISDEEKFLGIEQRFRF
ncbi:MAG: translocation/assembly module TamB domain-containing protein, partial [Elusimicrobiota bacterium]